MKIDQKQFTCSNGLTLPYIDMMPEKVLEPVPMLIFLHGVGERGTDNSSQFRNGHEFLTTAVTEYKVRVIAPQCPPDDYWVLAKWDDINIRFAQRPSRPMEALIELLNKKLISFTVDLEKIYCMGLSMGGFGTWDILMRCPQIFAAGVPICGGGDDSLAHTISRIPIWAFHGAIDNVVPVELSRKMITALKKAGARPRYTEYPDVAHDSWTNAFNDPALLDWILSQRKRDAHL